jgi:serine/threonine protein kinase
VPLEKKKDDAKERKRNRRKSKGVSLQGGGMTMSILELLQHIVNEPAPKLTPEGRFPKVAEDFVHSCLLKDPDQRRTPKDLLVRGPLNVGFWPFVYSVIQFFRTTSGSQMHERQTLIWRLGRAHSDRITVDADYLGSELGKWEAVVAMSRTLGCRRLSAREIHIRRMVINFSSQRCSKHFFCDVCILEKNTGRSLL